MKEDKGPRALCQLRGRFEQRHGIRETDAGSENSDMSRGGVGGKQVRGKYNWGHIMEVFKYQGEGFVLLSNHPEISFLEHGMSSGNRWGRLSGCLWESLPFPLSFITCSCTSQDLCSCCSLLQKCPSLLFCPANSYSSIKYQHIVHLLYEGFLEALM